MPESASTRPAETSPRFLIGQVGSARANVFESLRQIAQRRLPPAQAPEAPQALESAGVQGQLDLGAMAVNRGSQERIGVVMDIKEFQGWAIATLWTSERESEKLTGTVVAALKEGLEYKLTGEASNSARHGESFEVMTAEPHISDDDGSIIRYMRRSFDNIGEARARKYVTGVRENGGQDGIAALREQLLHSPWELDLSTISPKAKFSDGEGGESAAAQMIVLRALQLRMGSVPGFREATWKGLAAILSARTLALFNENKPKQPDEDDPLADPAIQIPPDFVNRALVLLLGNPYAFIGKAAYYGFPQAEQIGRRVGIPLDAPFRMAALVEYAVDSHCQSRGHSYLSKREFALAVKRADPSLSAQAALIEALKTGLVVLEEDRLYSRSLYEAEKNCAALIVGLLAHSEPITKRSMDDVKAKLNKDAAKVDANFVNGFDPAQVHAVASVMTSPTRLHVITGGPGTGKTTIVQALMYLCKNRSFAFGAPTGKAAKVLTSRVQPFGYEASTFHSMLRGDGSSFGVNESDPLDADIIVADETTMNGVQLGAAIMAAASSNAHLIFLGDPGIESSNPSERTAGQLPSISPGRFMQDLLKLPGVNHVNLTETFRNAGGILEVIREIEIGKLETRDRNNVKFSHGLPPAEVGFPPVMREYLAMVTKDGLDKTLLIMPKRVGERDTPGWNTTYANEVLRDQLNPHGEKMPGTTLRLGDRVMVRENLRIGQPDADDRGQVKGRLDRQAFSKMIDWDALREKGRKLGDPDDEMNPEEREERVVNGDTGTVVAYSVYPRGDRRSGTKWIRIALDDGREVEFPGDQSSSLDLAYALTVHSAQGSEYVNVISVITDGSPEFMNANMLKTAFSRAKTFLSAHGDDDVLRRIAATPSPQRNSTLVQRVVEVLAVEQAPEEQCAPAM